MNRDKPTNNTDFYKYINKQQQLALGDVSENWFKILKSRHGIAHQNQTAETSILESTSSRGSDCDVRSPEAAGKPQSTKPKHGIQANHVLLSPDTPGRGSFTTVQVFRTQSTSEQVKTIAQNPRSAQPGPPNLISNPDTFVSQNVDDISSCKIGYSDTYSKAACESDNKPDPVSKDSSYVGNTLITPSKAYRELRISEHYTPKLVSGKTKDMCEDGNVVTPYTGWANQTSMVRTEDALELHSQFSPGFEALFASQSNSPTKLLFKTPASVLKIPGSHLFTPTSSVIGSRGKRIAISLGVDPDKSGTSWCSEFVTPHQPGSTLRKEKDSGDPEKEDKFLQLGAARMLFSPGEAGYQSSQEYLALNSTVEADDSVDQSDCRTPNPIEIKLKTDKMLNRTSILKPVNFSGINAFKAHAFSYCDTETSVHKQKDLGRLGGKTHVEFHEESSVDSSRSISPVFETQPQLEETDLSCDILAVSFSKKYTDMQSPVSGHPTELISGEIDGGNKKVINSLTAENDDPLSLFISPPSQTSTIRRRIPKRAKRRALSEEEDFVLSPRLSPVTKRLKLTSPIDSPAVNSLINSQLSENNGAVNIQSQRKEDINFMMTTDLKRRTAEQEGCEMESDPELDTLDGFDRVISSLEQDGDSEHVLQSPDIPSNLKSLSGAIKNETFRSPLFKHKTHVKESSRCIGKTDRATPQNTLAKKENEISNDNEISNKTEYNLTNISGASGSKDVQSTQFSPKDIHFTQISPSALSAMCEAAQAQTQLSALQCSQSEVVSLVNCEHVTNKCRSAGEATNFHHASNTASKTHDTPLKWRNQSTSDVSYFKSEKERKDLNQNVKEAPVTNNSFSFLRKAKRFSYPSNSQINDSCPKRVFDFGADATTLSTSKTCSLLRKVELASCSSAELCEKSNEDKHGVYKTNTVNTNSVTDRPTVNLVSECSLNESNSTSPYRKSGMINQGVLNEKQQGPRANTLIKPILKNRMEISAVVSTSKGCIVKSDTDGTHPSNKTTYSVSCNPESTVVSSCNEKSANTLLTSCGFATASGKGLTISKSAIEKAEKLISEIPKETSPNALHRTGELEGKIAKSTEGKAVNTRFETNTRTKSSTTASVVHHTTKWNEESATGLSPSVSQPKNICLKTNAQSLMKVSEAGLYKDLITKERSDYTQLNDTSVATSCGGFRSASGKDIKITTESLKKAQSLLDEVSHNETDFVPENKENQLPLMFKEGPVCTINSKSNVKSAADDITDAPTSLKNSNHVLSTNLSVEPTGMRFNSQAVGFKCASGKQIEFSEKSLLKAQQMMEQVSKEADPSAVAHVSNESKSEPFQKDVDQKDDYLQSLENIIARSKTTNKPATKDYSKLPKGFRPFKTPRPMIPVLSSKPDSESESITKKSYSHSETVESSRPVWSNKDIIGSMGVHAEVHKQETKKKDTNRKKDRNMTVLEEDLMDDDGSVVEQFTFTQIAEITEGTAAFIDMDTQFPFTQPADSVPNDAIPPDHQLESESNSVVPPSQPINCKSNNAVPPKQTAKCESNSAIPPDRSANSESNNVMPPDPEAKTESDTELSPHEATLVMPVLTRGTDDSISQESEEMPSLIRETLAINRPNYAAQESKDCDAYITTSTCKKEKNTEANSFMGFQTAAGRTITVSEVALRQAKSVLQSIETHSASNETSHETNEVIVSDDTTKGDLVLSQITLSTENRGESRKVRHDFSDVLSTEFEDHSTVGKRIGYSHAAYDAAVRSNDVVSHNTENQEPIVAGFQTASGNRIKVNDKTLAKAMRLLNECDNKTTDSDLKETYSKSPKSSNVLLTNIVINSRLVNSEKITGFHLAGKSARESPDELINEVQVTDKQDRQSDAWPKYPGFQTAAGAEVKISEESFRKARQCLADFEKSTLEEMEHSLVASNSGAHSFETRKSPEHFKGFKTARGKPICVSEESLQHVQKLFDETDKPDTGEVATKVEPRTFLGFQTAAGNRVQVSEKSIDAVRAIFNETENDEEKIKQPVVFSGFQSASGKKVDISEDALKGARRLIGSELSGDSELKARAIVGYNHNYQAIGTHACTVYQENELTTSPGVGNVKSTRIVSEVNSNHLVTPKFEGFQTARGQKVEVSHSAIMRANQLFHDDNSNDAAMEAVVPEQRKQVIEQTVDKVKFRGFQTAAGERVKVSKESLQHVQQLFSDISEAGTSASVQTSVENVATNKPSKFLGFQTATGKEVNVSESSLTKARQLFRDNEQYDTLNTVVPQEYGTSKNKDETVNRQILSDSAFQGFHTDSGGRVNVSEQALQQAKTILSDTPIHSNASQRSSSVSFTGFQTAKGSKVNISQAALKRAKQLFKDDPASDIKGNALVPQTTSELMNMITNVNEGEDGRACWRDTAEKTSAHALEAARQVLSEMCHDEEDLHTVPVTPGKQIMTDTTDTKVDKKATVTTCEKMPLSSAPEGVSCDRDVNLKTVEMKAFVTAPQADASSKGVTESNGWTGITRYRRFVYSNSGCKDAPNTAAPEQHQHAKIPTVAISAKSKSGFQTPIKSANAAGSRGASVSKGGSGTSFSTPYKKVSPQTSFKTPVKTPGKQLVPETCNLTPTDSDVNVKTNPSTYKEETTSQDPEISSSTNTQVSAEVLKRRLHARVAQAQAIRKKREAGSTRPKAGRMWRERTSGGASLVSLQSCTQGDRPSSYTAQQLYAYGVRTSTTEISSKTAENFRFAIADFYGSSVAKCAEGVKAGDGGFIIMADDCTIGKKEFSNALLAMEGVEPRLVSQDWVYNHYRWILWKLASYEVSLPQHFGARCVSPEHVLLQLKYRYDREVDLSHRSALKRIYERDDTPAKCMVLCVADVLTPPNQQPDKQADKPHSVVLELTDGWYSIRSSIDAVLTRLLHAGALRVGDKLAMSGAELLGPQDGCTPLEAPESVMLKINANSTRRAAWYSKLGYCSNPRPPSLPLSSLHPAGGAVGCISVIVTRVYPMQYLEKRADGTSLVRSQRAEDRAARVHERNSQRHLDTLVSKLQQEFESRQAAGESDEESMRDEFAARMREVTSEVAQRQVTAMLKIRLAGCHRADIDVNASTLMTVWRPGEDVRALLVEGQALCCYNVAVGEIRGKSNNAASNCSMTLTAQRSTTYRKQTLDDNLMDMVYTPREVVNLNELHSGYVTSHGELDVVGLVVHVSSPHVYERASGEEGSVQTVYLADAEGEFLGVKFWSGLQSYCLEEVMSVHSYIACCNVQWRYDHRARVQCATAADLSSFSTNPREKHLKLELDKLKSAIPSTKVFVSQMQDRLQERLSNRIRVPPHLESIAVTRPVITPLTGTLRRAVVTPQTNQFASPMLTKSASFTRGNNPETPTIVPRQSSDGTPASFSRGRSFVTPSTKQHHSPINVYKSGNGVIETSKNERSNCDIPVDLLKSTAKRVTPATSFSSSIILKNTDINYQHKSINDASGELGRDENKPMTEKKQIQQSKAAKLDIYMDSMCRYGDGTTPSSNRSFSNMTPNSSLILQPNLSASKSALRKYKTPASTRPTRLGLSRNIRSKTVKKSHAEQKQVNLENAAMENQFRGEVSSQSSIATELSFGDTKDVDREEREMAGSITSEDDIHKDDDRVTVGDVSSSIESSPIYQRPCGGLIGDATSTEATDRGEHESVSYSQRGAVHTSKSSVESQKQSRRTLKRSDRKFTKKSSTRKSNIMCDVEEYTKTANSEPNDCHDTAMADMKETSEKLTAAKKRKLNHDNGMKTDFQSEESMSKRRRSLRIRKA